MKFFTGLPYPVRFCSLTCGINYMRLLIGLEQHGDRFACPYFITSPIGWPMQPDGICMCSRAETVGAISLM